MGSRIVNEILFYKAQTEIVAYDGSLPQTISKKLGDLSNYKYCVAGRNKDTYYIIGEVYDNGSTKYHMYAYDARKGFWVEDDDKQYAYLASWNNICVGAINDEIHLFDVGGALTTTTESDLKWSFETDKMDYYTENAKYVKKIVIKATLSNKSRARVYIAYDDKPHQLLFEMRSVGTKVYPLTIIPRRCDRFSIKVEGIGDAVINQLTKVFETGSDVY